MTRSRLAGRLVVSLAFAALGPTLAPLPAAADCGQAPSDAALAGTPDEVFARAKAAFSAKRFTEAGPLFRALALKSPESDAGRNAVVLSIESFNQSAKGDARDACFDAIAEVAPKYLPLYCSPGSKSPDAEPCPTLHSIQRDVLRLQAEQLVLRADKETRSRARPLYVEAGHRYISIWTTELRDACRDKTSACRRADEILYNAAHAFHAGGALPKAVAARSILIDPAYNLSNTELAKKSLYEQGAEYQSIAEYAEAARYYERYALVAPKDDRAPDALQDATALRLGLSDLAAAQKNAELMEKYYESKLSDRVALVDFAIAVALGEREQWADVEKILGGRHAIFARAPLLLQMRADALLGKALDKQGKKPAADAAYQRVAAITPDQLVRKIDPGDDFTARRELAHALIALGEARLHAADEARDEAMKLELKKGDTASLAAKRAAVDKAERAYVAIFEIQPVPPPSAVVAAGRVARMRSQLWAREHLALGPAAAEPEERAARAANEKCVSFSVKYQFADAGSRACAAWLARHAFARFPPLPEIQPRPRWRGDGITAEAPLGRADE